ncbi:hypothetical protein RM572_28415 [Streptomyces sp. DSM 42041]|uniref:YwqI/YxiC family protein n=1 Tax=Streptomyces hazeniae TaxID=3075538 RepID=A0ABU2P0B8_9ACTN|nr:hypothetical protein [Streptomyces sp. DSM 42041]MDT0382678.1 hypothetical protein [Streptomyces sp. DSM 42041]
MGDQAETVSGGYEIVGAVGAGGLFLLLIVVVWQVAATWRARMLAAREEQYKQLAHKYAQLLEDNVALHRRSMEELTEARKAITGVERSMRVVERAD